MKALKTSKNFRAQAGRSPVATRWLPRVATLQDRRIGEALAREALRRAERRGQLLVGGPVDSRMTGSVTTSPPRLPENSTASLPKAKHLVQEQTVRESRTDIMNAQTGINSAHAATLPAGFHQTRLLSTKDDHSVK